jgi:hypothetical protein
MGIEPETSSSYSVEVFGVMNTILYTLYIFPMPATYPDHLNYIYLITLIIYGEECGQ